MPEITLALISDTHGHHEAIHIPPCDIVVCAGDMTHSTKAVGLQELQNFLIWLTREAKGTQCVMTFGNHDWVGLRFPEESRLLCERHGVTLLHGSAATVGGLRFWGSPRTPEFRGYAYMYLPDEAEAVWDEIPEGVDVIVTHGPPRMFRDKTVHGVRAGCPVLAKRVRQIQPALHVFGHIHESRGVRERDGVMYVNASSVDFAIRTGFPPMLMTLEQTGDRWQAKQLAFEVTL